MEIIFRRANTNDLPILVEMLREDELEKNRETHDMIRYKAAWVELKNDPNNQIIIGEIDNKIITMLQLTFIRHLTFQGGLRAQIEGVRTHKNYRRQGIGQKLIEYAVQLAKEKNCHLIQLTSNQLRLEALGFYEKLGFKPTHIGFKMTLEDSQKKST